MGKVWNGRPHGYMEVYSSYEAGLKSCPFCGSGDIWLVRSPSMYKTYAVICNDCGIDAMFCGAEHNKDKMIEKWNSEPKGTD